MRAFLAVPSTLLMIASLGCGGAEVNTVSFQRQRLDGVSYDSAYQAAERAVAERFQVSQRNSQGGVIRGATHETSRRASSLGTDGILGERLTGARTRHTATVRVRDVNGDVEIYCRVQVQENTADSVRMLRSENTVFDQPHATPADRDAGTTQAQNAVWKNRGRDRAMEREILASIREITQKDVGGP